MDNPTCALEAQCTHWNTCMYLYTHFIKKCFKTCVVFLYFWKGRQIMGFYGLIFFLDTQFHRHKEIRRFIQDAGAEDMGNKRWYVAWEALMWRKEWGRRVLYMTRVYWTQSACSWTPLSWCFQYLSFTVQHGSHRQVAGHRRLMLHRCVETLFSSVLISDSLDIWPNLGVFFTFILMARDAVFLMWVTVILSTNPCELLL